MMSLIFSQNSVYATRIYPKSLLKILKQLRVSWYSHKNDTFPEIKLKSIELELNNLKVQLQVQ